MNAHVRPEALGPGSALSFESRPRLAAERFDGLTKLGRDLPCMRCEGDAVTVAVHRRGEMDVERVECACCGLRYRRVNPI